MFQKYFNITITALLAVLLASCAGDGYRKPLSFNELAEPTVTSSNNEALYSDVLSLTSRAKIVAISGVNTFENSFLNTSINNLAISGQVKGLLVDYYYLDVQKGDRILTQLDNDNVVVFLETKNRSETTYQTFLPEYPNLANIDGRLKIGVMIKDPAKVKSLQIYNLTLLVKDKQNNLVASAKAATN